MEENSRNVQISWAGRVRTGNKRIFDYTKDLEVGCRFKEMLTREAVYKQLEKVEWPLLSIVGMVLRPGCLVDFTLKSKDLALKFAKSLSNLESVQNATAHADTVVEVCIDFIPPGYLKWKGKPSKLIQYPVICTSDNINFVFAIKDKVPLVATALRVIMLKEIAPKNPI